MEITVKLFAMFRVGRFAAGTYKYRDGITPADIAGELKIPEKDVGIVLVNSRHAKLDHRLFEGDTLSLFPLVGGG
ncbi:thiamine S protein [Geobacter metallireducens RCH3]|uniref:Molybdopterin biosynthesis sulfur carrier protein n=1 Tax=Geobacter metallireducens (strain ATCC 53774 / DSM 7210 / GS-15) TaxID=269799 RepID=Q39WU0_GEOMG|nr:MULTISPECIES: MoaD/ThiS family protein [Geobacter]ABB31284.1 molybdopterin biosynthesis sulfur carrier protein [Geobacter metallireducens GS-15]EHP86531.1 thiamine S protein [Geobacter metallireducens RCH3]MBT1076172.1 MoaD/ThiS family protein [Geobacter grbiciae]